MASPARHFAIFLFYCLLVIGSSNAQTVYQSIGPDGKTIYSDHPISDAKIVKTTKFEYLPSSVVPPSTMTNLDTLRKKKPSQNVTAHSDGITLYSAPWCGYCKKAKAYLNFKGIAYQDVDIDTLDGKLAFAQTGKKSIPFLVDGRRAIQGFSLAAYDAFLAVNNRLHKRQYGEF